MTEGELSILAQPGSIEVVFYEYIRGMKDSTERPCCKCLVSHNN